MIKSEDPRLEDSSISNINKNFLAVYSELTKKMKFMNKTYRPTLSELIHLECYPDLLTIINYKVFPLYV